MNAVIGLIRKDWALMYRSLRLLIVYIAIFTGFIPFAMGNSQTTLDFSGTFIPLLLFSMSINCFAYDEQAHFDKLSAALPLHPWQTVTARYLTAVSIGAAGAVLTVAADRITLLIRPHQEAVPLKPLLTGLAAAIVILCVLFPLIYKFGVNKSRIFLFIIVGVVTTLFSLMPSILLKTLSGIFRPSAAFQRVLPGLIACALILFLAGSIALSIRIVRTKEY